MEDLVFWGIFSFGFVIGYLLYYVARRTATINAEFLTTVISAIGGATVLAFIGDNVDFIGPYGIGLLAGFATYFFLTLVFWKLNTFDKASEIGILGSTNEGFREFQASKGKNK